MGSRLQLQALLETLLPGDAVYFQPPTNTALQYPCIIYNRDDIDTRYADNYPYSHKTRYQVTVVDRDPDSGIKDRIKNMAESSFVRFFVKDNLNHDVFAVYF